MVKSLSIRQKKVLALHLNTMIILKKIKRRKQSPRKWWVHPIWKERNEQGDYKMLVSSICTCHPITFMKPTMCSLATLKIYLKGSSTSKEGQSFLQKVYANGSKGI